MASPVGVARGGHWLLRRFATLAYDRVELEIDVLDEMDPWNGGAVWFHAIERDVRFELWAVPTRPDHDSLAVSVAGALLQYVRRIEVRRTVQVADTPLDPFTLFAEILPPERRVTLVEHMRELADDLGALPAGAISAVSIYAVGSAQLFVSAASCHWFDFDGADVLQSRPEPSVVLREIIEALVAGRQYLEEDFVRGML